MSEIDTSNELLTEEQVSVWIGKSVSTLQKWRCTRLDGPPFVKVGRSVRYRRGDVQKWLDKNTVGVGHD